MRKYQKLTDSLKNRIKDGKVKKSTLKGEALTYYNRVQGAKKARKAKAAQKKKPAKKVAKKSTTKVKAEKIHIPKGSELYKLIERAAKAKNMTVAQFMKKHKASVLKLKKDGDVIQNRETEYVIGDITSMTKASKVFLNDLNGYVKTSKKTAIYRLQSLVMHCAEYTNIFLIIYRVRYKLNGDIYLFSPPIEEYQELTEDEEVSEFLDTYYPEITYIKSEPKPA